MYVELSIFDTYWIAHGSYGDTPSVAREFLIRCVERDDKSSASHHAASCVTIHAGIMLLDGSIVSVPSNVPFRQRNYSNKSMY